MIKQPKHLKKGDTIAIVCPAKKLPTTIDSAVEVLQSWGLKVVIGKTVNAEYRQFAGPDELRRDDLQQYLDAPEIKAIIAARGGYGTLRIIDKLDFSSFAQNPKWLIGFSDITVLLSHAYANFSYQSIHAQMPYTFEESTPEALESLRKALFGEKLIYETNGHELNKAGEVTAKIIGGNLSLLIALEGSVSAMDFDGKILFIEDVGEHEYAIDRMMRTLYRNGKLKKLAGLIVGAFNGMQPEPIPFGQTPEQLIAEIVKAYDYPVCFGFPTGHIDDNRAMVVGKHATLTVTAQKTTLTYID